MRTFPTCVILFVVAAPAIVSLLVMASGILAAEPVASSRPTADAAASTPIDKGLRVFSCNHSFSVNPKLLSAIAASAGIKDHEVAGVSSIGGSKAIQHFQVPDATNLVKPALIAGKIDVLTLSCMARPDEGISLFAKLALEHNPNVRVTLQELWIPEDHWPFDPHNRVSNSVDNFDASTVADLQKAFDPYGKLMDDYVIDLNKTLGKQVVFVVPDGLAAISLRQRIIAGTAPGLKKQSDLFSDAWGHPRSPLAALSAYCHFAVIYRRSPIGLECKLVADPAQNRMLQELAWDAVIHHPLSGVSDAATTKPSAK